jgi:excisionase family DNA binding protein
MEWMDMHGVPPMTTATSIEPLITIASAARQSGVAPWTLYRLVRESAIPPVRVAGKVRRVKLSDVLAAIEQQPAST